MSRNVTQNELWQRLSETVGELNHTKEIISQIPFVADLIERAKRYELQKGEETLWEIYDRGEISVRTRNCMVNADVRNLADLMKRTRSNILDTKGMGAKGLAELESVLSRRGLTFQKDIHGF